MTMSTLREIVARLGKLYGTLKAPPLRDPFELVLYENVSYLVDDERRWKAFENLRKEIGIDPDEILNASPAAYESVVALAGSDKKGRVAKLVRAAEIAVKEFGGELGSVLTLPFKKAVAAMKNFPSIGEPGAEKILLFCGRTEVLPLESNGLRVLVRIGFAREETNYSAMYRNVRSAIADQITHELEWLVSAHLLLRQHGQLICKRTQPLCTECVLLDQCSFGQTNVKLARG